MRKASILIKAIKKAMRIDITKRNRTHEYTFARHIYFFYAKKFTTMSLAEIGRSCGGRDHVTALKGVERFEKLFATKDEKFVGFHDRCAEKINNTGEFNPIKFIQEPEPKEMVYPKSRVNEVIRNAFLSNGITDDIMNMSKEEINEMVKYKVRPHILMLRSRKRLDNNQIPS